MYTIHAIHCNMLIDNFILACILASSDNHVGSFWRNISK